VFEIDGHIDGDIDFAETIGYLDGLDDDIPSSDLVARGLKDHLARLGFEQSAIRHGVGQTVRTESGKWTRVIKEAGIRAD